MTGTSVDNREPVLHSPYRLAPYAVSEEVSRGRTYSEPHPSWRTPFQRDRDRIIHCSAFRRLEYKTQVFVNHEGDMFRTRLTHSLEVAQVARTIARALRLNEDLTEAIALAHDLGHTPFGHAGQHALNHCMRKFGGFEHNLHSLRVVDVLEERYPSFFGLNLLYETREGILKHCSMERARDLGELGQRFLHHRQPSLEAQIANIADEIAYNHHDIDDGIRASLLSLEQLQRLALFKEIFHRVETSWPGLSLKRLRYSAIREMLNYFVGDLIQTSRDNIAREAPQGLDDVRAAAAPLINFSTVALNHHLSLKRLLRNELYQHPQVYEMAERSKSIVSDLFHAFMDNPQLLPPDMRIDIEHHESLRAQRVADYIAGMTDRFAIAAHAALQNSAHDRGHDAR